MNQQMSTAIPQQTAEHFCRLLVCDSEGNISSITTFLCRQTPSSNTQQHQSPSTEQLFASYIFDYDGWQTLHIFPYQSADGTVTWYAPTDSIPHTIDAEHHKYIREALPRLQAEVKAGNWQTVDAFIDRMILYQTTYGAQTQPANSVALPLIFAIIFSSATLLFLAIVSRIWKRLFTLFNRH